jgi:hypothetical protein
VVIVEMGPYVWLFTRKLTVLDPGASQFTAMVLLWVAAMFWVRIGGSGYSFVVVNMKPGEVE